ncbi:hypothetical protein Poli38472_011377 [Pythium oligandrum]|uniref:Uncharacterized protein n=1 Tax=Pythium oligandrum TaxID=41045 RepID=A0A8K1CLH7_PYTOL|nr:hypothetical protein Poli38472_011377 [Pythium oligandrum]|eukprot:TMW64497.1 hypothetical protein Poli38472_011377 [Pythium oligandrum]
MAEEQIATAAAEGLPAIVVASQDNRRLASDYLVNLVRSASGDTQRAAVKKINAHCNSELTTFCITEVQLVQSIHRVTNGGTAPGSASALADALRNVHVCLAERPEVLSSSCQDAFTSQFLMPSSTGDPGWNYPDGDRGNHGRGHGRKPKVRRSDDDSDDRSVGIYVINGPPSGEAYGGAIDHPGARHHHHSSTAGTVALWLFVPPFFVVGLAFTVKHAVAYVKQRRGFVLTVHSTGYAPLKTTPDSP